MSFIRVPEDDGEVIAVSFAKIEFLAVSTFESKPKLVVKFVFDTGKRGSVSIPISDLKGLRDYYDLVAQDRPELLAEMDG